MSWQKNMSRGTQAMAREDYAAAEDAFSQALKEAKAQFASDDARIPLTMSVLGQSYFKQGDYSHAEPLLRQSSKMPGLSAMGRAIDHILLAQIMKEEGKASQAHKHYQQAVVVLEQMPAACNTNDGEDTIQAMGDLLKQALARENQKSQMRFQELLNTAQSKHKESKRKQDFSPVPKDPVERWRQTLDDGMQLLGNGSSGESNTVPAYLKLHEATKHAYTIFPHDHPNIAESLQWLAQVSDAASMHDQCESLYKRAVAILENHRETEGTKLAVVKLNQATFYAGIHDYRTAITHFTEAADYIEKSGDCDAQKMLDLYYSVLAMMQKADLYTSARELTRQAIEHEDLDRLEQASKLYDNVLALLRRVFPEDHPELAQMLYFKANVLRRLGDNKEAETAERMAEAIEGANEAKTKEIAKMMQKLPPFRIPPSRSLPNS